MPSDTTTDHIPASSRTGRAPLLIPVYAIDEGACVGAILLERTPERLAALTDAIDRAAAVTGSDCLESDTPLPDRWIPCAELPAAILDAIDDHVCESWALPLPDDVTLPPLGGPDDYAPGRLTLGRVRAVRVRVYRDAIAWTALVSGGDHDDDTRVRTEPLDRHWLTD